MPDITVKAIQGDDGEWTLDVLGNPWYGPVNGKDIQGEYFDQRTNFHEDKFPRPPVVYYHGFDPSGRPMGRPEYIGKTIGREVKSDGVWYKVILDKAKPLAQRIWDYAQKGLAFASSGSANHLRRVGPSGHIDEWPVIELTLVELDGRKRPVNGYAVALPAVKAVYEQAGIEWPDVEISDVSGAETDSPEADTQGAGVSETSGAVESTIKAEDNMAENETTALSPEEVTKLVNQSVADALKADREAQKAEQEAEQKRQEEMAEAIKAERAKWEEEVKASRRLPFSADDAPVVTEFHGLKKYETLSGPQAALAIGLLKANKESVPQGLYDYAAVKAFEQDRPLTPMNIANEVEDERVMLKALGYHDQAAVESAIKANEADYSTSTGFGKEWVTVMYSNALWEVIRQANPVLDRMNQYAVEVPQGASTIRFHLESTDPTWYVVAEAVATASGGPARTVTTSRIGTANQTLSVAKLGAAVPFSGELEEDSIIPLMPQIERQIAVSGANYLASAIIDGDTNTSSAGINDAAGTAGSTDWHVVMDGFRKLALVTNSANARDAGALTVEDYLLTLQLMGAGGKNAYVGGPQTTSFIQDPNVNWAALQLPEVKTRDVYSAPTVENGMLTQIWGREVITSYNMHRASLGNSGYEYKTEATGYIDIDTPGDNTKGAILAVRWDQWKLGYKRRITLERERYARADLTEIVAMMRVGMVYRDTEAAAISYDITV